MVFPTHGNRHVTDHGETTIHGLGIIIAATSPDRTSGQGGQNQHSVHTSTAEVGGKEHGHHGHGHDGKGGWNNSDSVRATDIQERRNTPACLSTTL